MFLGPLFFQMASPSTSRTSFMFYSVMWLISVPHRVPPSLSHWQSNACVPTSRENFDIFANALTLAGSFLDDAVGSVTSPVAYPKAFALTHHFPWILWAPRFPFFLELTVVRIVLFCLSLNCMLLSLNNCFATCSCL